MRSLQLTRPATITLNGSGAGTAQLGPVSAGESWQLARASVICSAAVATGDCQAQIYIGPSPSQPYFVDGTFSGDTGDTTDAVAGRIIHPGSYVWAVWASGMPGASATLTITGTRQVP